MNPLRWWRRAPRAPSAGAYRDNTYEAPPKPLWQRAPGYVGAACICAVAGAIVATVSLTTACAAHWGAPNEKTAAYDLHCGADTCDYRYNECSVSKPTRCEFVGEHEFGKARDAGAAVPMNGDAAAR